MRTFIPIAALLIAAGCSSPENDYCARLGTPSGSPEYARCTAYYFQQEEEFRRDRMVCAAEADKVYPQSLYSQGTWVMTRDWFGKPDMVPVQPDWQQNHTLDEMRMTRIIDPCMQAHGWNSGRSWQAGRHSTGRAAASSSGSKPLPWRKKAGMTK
jgi:hypothetical protein